MKSSPSKRAFTPADPPDDDVLIQRLAALGYTPALPPLEPPHIAQPSPSKRQKTSIERFMEAVERNIRRGTREMDLGRLMAEDSDSEDEDQDDRTSGPGSPTTSPSSGSPTLASLTAVIDAHRRHWVKEKEKKARAKGGSAEATPSKAQAERLADLSLNSAGGLKTTSTKRQRLASNTTPSSPSSPIRRNAATRSSRSQPPSPPKQSSPMKRQAVRVPAFLAACSLAAASSSSSLATTLAGLSNDIPGLTLPQLVLLSTALQDSRILLATAHERAAGNGRVFGAPFNLLGKTLFPTDTPTHPQSAIFTLARALDLYPPPSGAGPSALPAAPPLAAPPRILSTRHTSCVQCASPLTLRYRRTDHTVHLADVSGAVPVLIALHSCVLCGAVHAPDHVEVVLRGQRVWVWDADAEAIKVGERVWVTRVLAEHYAALLLEQAVSPGGFAEFWMGLYGADADADDDDSADSSSEDDTRPPSSPSKKKTAKRRRSSALRLRSEHLFRSLVLLSSFRALPSSRFSQLATPARPSTAVLVQLANRDLFNSSGGDGEARVLGGHTCEGCTRQRARWKGGPADEEEKARGLRWAGAHAKEGARYEQDTVDLPGTASFAVCDGIALGHPLCAYPACPNPPEAHRRSRRFCSAHSAQHGVCGVHGCGAAVSLYLDADGRVSEACDDAGHRAMWERWNRRREAVREGGWRGRGRQGRYAVPRVEEEGSETGDEQEEEEEGEEKKPQLASDSDLGEDSLENATKTEKVMTTWSLRRTTTLQLLVAACGTPLAFTTFSAGETTSALVAFLSSAHAQLPIASPPAFPSYIAYDRACAVLRHILSPSPSPSPSSAPPRSLPPFLRTTRLVLTAFHRRAHPASDRMCRALCDPAPLDGRAEDLVVPFRLAGKKCRRGREKPAGRGEGGRTFERAFNTSAAEQLNSSLSRYAPLLSTLRADNFEFVVQVVLRHRRERMAGGRRDGGGGGKGRTYKAKRRAEDSAGSEEESEEEE
ncbi:hypothetical protein JCM10207_000631 [Rhodosporidiobolus poonsookiae]